MSITSQDKMTNNSSDPTNGGKNWELSLYELNRAPQEIIVDLTEIAVSPRSLHSELMCPICLDMLTQTMTTKECLHRFCQDCIITALRSGNKECPTCRKKLVSKRSLRPDPNFDELIKRIYPNREEYESQQEKVIAKVNQNKFMQNVEESLRMQVLNRARSNKRPNPDDDTTITSGGLHDTSGTDHGGGGNKRTSLACGISSELDDSEDDDGSSHHLPSPVPEVELVITPLPQIVRKDPSNTVRFLKTIVTATIDHIAKYLQMRHNVEGSPTTTSDQAPHQAHHLSCSSVEAESKAVAGSSCSYPYTIYMVGGPGQFNPIRGGMTLQQVHEKYWPTSNKPLELFYAYKMNETSGSSLVTSRAPGALALAGLAPQQLATALNSDGASLATTCTTGSLPSTSTTTSSSNGNGPFALNVVPGLGGVSSGALPKNHKAW